MVELLSLELQLKNTLLVSDTDYGEDEEELEDERDSLAASLAVDEDLDPSGCSGDGGSSFNAKSGSEPELLQELGADSELVPKPAKKMRTGTDSLTDIEIVVRKASEQVVVTNTIQEYARLWDNFIEFCVNIGYVDSVKTALEAELGSNGSTPANYPIRIASWIMSKCDEIDIETNEPKPLSMPRLSYGYAQKMRSAISHKFGREFQRGTQPWMEKPGFPGNFVGNPSLSSIVSQYMISLRRRKVRAGEVVTSARAIDEDALKKLWEFNTKFVDTPPGLKRKAEISEAEQWGGRELRLMLQVMYIISFLCLLRFDEALRLQWSWISLDKVQNGSGKWVHRIILMLPFRKTHQTGGIAPFYLLPHYEKPWLCPVATLATWIDHMKTHKQGNLNGFVFRRKFSARRVSDSPDEGMSSDSFLKSFRNNLTDIGTDPRPYGTHSFRRGGCQYLHFTLRWGIIDVCCWGGWADDFDNQGTIFKYLLSWTDRQRIRREDFFDPDRRTKSICGACGRSCPCC